jgi:hypothetical protein
MYTARPTTALTVVFAVVGFITGCGMAQFRIPGYGSVGAITSVLVLSFATFAWFRNDAVRRLYPSSPAFNIAFVAFTIAALPYYLLRSRGVWGTARSLGAAFLIYILYVATMILGTVLVRAFRI